ncbi:predicted protein [Chaetoceros tenuissimus]|uniref:Uncharacterized protein n=1 Tax=Chaetoceros tenuissimus TaxID=426638 RepID=A0AAD3CRB3_9STRA|nr:predicted protein [Chaetoceros tenuissimus]
MESALSLHLIGLSWIRHRSLRISPSISNILESCDRHVSLEECKHRKAIPGKLSFDPARPDDVVSPLDGASISKVDWTECYPDAKEQLPCRMPTPHGAAVLTRAYVDGNHAVLWIEGKYNLADLFSKTTIAGDTQWNFVNQIFKSDSVDED